MSEARSTAITGAESRRSPILFVTRNFPPVRGGLERYSWDLYRSLSANEPIDLCANRRGRAYLVPFLARAVFYLIVHGRRYTHIHFGDGMLAPLALFARSLGRAQTSITIHGLDITYPNALFQFLIPTCVRRIDQVVCVSHATLQECVARGISADRCTVIPNGIIFDDLSSPQGSFEGLEQKYGFERVQRRVLLSVSRLVQRKGHAWFVSQVMPRLDASYLFLIAGEGPERPRIEAAIDRAGLADRVVLMGSVSDEEKVTLLSEADLFVMPNLHIQGDLEGFGISLLEAAAYGLPSIAAYADGIVDAVIDGKTGLLVPEQDARAFAEAISSCVLDPAQVKAAVRESYSWSDLVKRYWDLFGGVTMNGQRSRAELQSLHGPAYVKRYHQSDQGRLSRLVPLMHLEPGMVVADLGCGNGLLLEQIHTQVHRYDGVDFSPEFIDQARDRQKLAQITNAEFHQESIGAFLKQRLNRYDRIFAMDFSEHVYDEELVEILSAARRALKQEGRVFLHTPNLSFFLERLKDWRVLKQLPEHVRVRTADGNASILHRAGFSQVQVRYLPHYLPVLSWIHVFSRIPWLGRCLRARLFIEARP